MEPNSEDSRLDPRPFSTEAFTNRTKSGFYYWDRHQQLVGGLFHYDQQEKKLFTKTRYFSFGTSAAFKHSFTSDGVPYFGLT